MQYPQNLYILQVISNSVLQQEAHNHSGSQLPSNGQHEHTEEMEPPSHPGASSLLQSTEESEGQDSPPLQRASSIRGNQHSSHGQPVPTEVGKL